MSDDRSKSSNQCSFLVAGVHGEYPCRIAELNLWGDSQGSQQDAMCVWSCRQVHQMPTKNRSALQRIRRRIRKGSRQKNRKCMYKWQCSLSLKQTILTKCLPVGSFRSRLLRASLGEEWSSFCVVCITCTGLNVHHLQILAAAVLIFHWRWIRLDPTSTGTMALMYGKLEAQGFAGKGGKDRVGQRGDTWDAWWIQKRFQLLLKK